MFDNSMIMILFQWLNAKFLHQMLFSFPYISSQFLCEICMHLWNTLHKTSYTYMTNVKCEIYWHYMSFCINLLHM